MAIACSRLFTLPPRPDFPRRSVPFFRRLIALLTLLPAPLLYFRRLLLAVERLRVVAIAASWQRSIDRYARRSETRRSTGISGCNRRRSAVPANAPIPAATKV